jgi:hypothetical protein
MTTKPDTLKVMRNQLALTTFSLALGSLICVMAMNWWIVPLDYWLMHMSIAMGLGSIICFVLTCIAQVEYLEATRSN